MRELRRVIQKILLTEYRKYNSENCPHEAVFKQVRQAKIFGEEMPSLDWDQFAQEVIDEKKYENKREDFEPAYYTQFDDWFLRRLSADTFQKCIDAAAGSTIVSPCQGTVRQEVPDGLMTLKRSVIHLDTLLGILNLPSILQISLRKTDYHRIHSPCDGVVRSVERYQQHELFKESEACTILDIESSSGTVTLMMIGEWTVQTFITDIEPGDRVQKLQELGYFYFGSQVIIGSDMMLKPLVVPDNKTRVFPGDPLYE